MTGSNALNKPKSIILDPNSPINFLVHGQGVFIFSCEQNETYFFISNADQSDGLIVTFTSHRIYVKQKSTGKYYIDYNNNSGIINKKGAYYWFSLDSQNTRFYAGIGEARKENLTYQANYDSRTFLESLVTIVPEKNILPLRLLRDPITENIALFVADTKKLTMDDVAAAKFMPTANMSPVCQQLYDCISGRRFVLDTPDFPDFTRAIQHSIDTKGLWCYETLQRKSTEFNPNQPNILETYLRITLGQNNGESPGIPYVMEIWPSGHYSPIHNHSGANAIIRVLHGSINVALFPFLCPDGIEPFSVADFNKNDVTWISANLNQIHQLKNLETNKDACITIQCYMYDKYDSIHYDFFDYVDDNGTIQHYNPDSDMEFLAFKEQMRMEWDEYCRRKYKKQRKN